MSETPNYKLPITEDPKTKFRQWRDLINGPGDSAMNKIDQALAEKVNHRDPIETVLKSSEWSSGSTPYVQTLSIEGMTSESNGIVGISQSAAFEQREIAREAILFVQSQGEDTLTIAADGDCPTADIPITIILLD